MKRTLCKGCHNVLIPGITARIRVRSEFIPIESFSVFPFRLIGMLTASPSFGHCISYTCLDCSTTRKIPAPRNIEMEPPITDAPTSIVENRVGKTVDVHVPALEATIPPETTKLEEHEVWPKEEKKEEKKGRKKKKVVIRQQPLFARRSQGHVVFRGMEVVDAEGVYCA